MTDDVLDSGSHRYGNINLSGSASAQLGDQYFNQHGDEVHYHIQTAHFAPVPSGELVHINQYFERQPRPDIGHSFNRESSDQLDILLEKLSEYDAPIAHWQRSCLRIDGTCTWIFEHAEFERWMQTESVALTCIGPGKCLDSPPN